MPRVAGNSDTYDFHLDGDAWVLVGADGEPRPEDRIPVPPVRSLPSVTTVTDLLSKGGALTGWAYKIAIQGMLEVARKPGRIDIAQLDYEKAKDLFQAFGLRTPWSKKDRDRGEEAHNVLEKLAKGEWDLAGAHRHIEMHIPEEWQGYAYGAAAWWDDTEGDPEQVLAAEKRVWSQQAGGFAGTLDLFYQTGHDTFNGAYGSLIDLKTRPVGKPAVYPENGYQLAGYGLAVRESMGLTVEDYFVLTTRDDGTYNFNEIEHEEIESNREVFLNLVRLWWALQGPPKGE